MAGLPEGFEWIQDSDGDGYEEGVASTFGYDDPMDEGVGAWGDNTNTSDAWGVSLPIQTLREIFGDDDAAYGAVVELLNPVTGQRVKAPIVDKGPAEWVINRQGPTIDVTEGVRRELGLSGMDPMKWRVLGHGVESDRPAAAPGGLPEGFQWLDNGAVPEGSTEVATGQGDGFKWVDEGPKTEGDKSYDALVAQMEKDAAAGTDPLAAKRAGEQGGGDEDTIPLEPVSERPGGVAAPGQEGAMLEGFQWIEETPQEARSKRRQTLIDAIAKTEASGFPVDHTIGKPDEPEGDRAPTVDMENLVGALKQAEKAGWAQGNTQAAMMAAGERAYWENEIKTKGMTEKQDLAAQESYGKGVPQQEIAGFEPVQQRQAPPEKLYDYATGERAQEGEPYRYGTGTQPKTLPALPEGQLDIIDAANSFGRGVSAEGLLAATEGGYASIAANVPDWMPESATIRKNAQEQRDKVAAMRERVRKEHLPVDRDFEEHLVGQVLQGGGQLVANLPFYAVPGAGPVIAAFQLYDEARQDYKAAMKDQGRKVDDAQANGTALKYLMVAGPLEVWADKLMIRKFLKGAVGRTGKEIVKDAAKSGLGEGLTEAGQQLWLNTVAKIQGDTGTEGYDPERPLTKELLSSFLVGGILGTGVSLAGGALPKKKEGFPMPSEQDEKLARLRATLEGMKQQGPAPAPQPAAPQAAPGVAKETEEGDSYTRQPTSDEELDRMQEEYVNGPAKSKPQESEKVLVTSAGSVFSQHGKPNETTRQRAQREWDNLSPDARFNDQRENIRLYKNQAKALGIEFELEAGDGNPRISSHSDGTIKLRVSLRKMFDREHFSNLPKGGETKIALGEETIHAGDIMGLKKLWDKSDQKARWLTDPEDPQAQDFIDYINEQGVSVFNDIESSIANAPLREQQGLYQAMADSFSLYFGQFHEDYLAPKVPAGPEVFDRIRKHTSSQGYKGASMTAGFVREFSRMAKQMESQGIVSEHTARKVVDAIRNWVKSALDRIVNALPGVRQGKFGKAAQNELKRIDDTLKELGVSVPRLTPEEQMLAKTEKAPSTASRPSLGTRMKEFFLPRPKPREAPDDLREEMAKLAPKDRLRAAIQVKGETFSADTHYAAMKAAIKKHGRMNVGDAVAGDVDYQGKFIPWERSEQRQETREGPATVNIGLATDDGKGITEAEVLRALRDAGVNVTSHRVEQSGTEPTVVAYLDQTLEPEEAFKLAVDLDQEAIAEQWMGGAELYGPQAEAWRPFNKEYFISQKQADPELMRGLDELEKIARDYEKWKTWYKDFNAFLDRVLLPENRVYKPLITDFIAATSPAEGIKQNSLQALRKLREFVETGTVTTQGGLGLAGKSKLPNLMRAIRGERLSGPKVEPFSQAMKLDPNAAAIDRHVAMILFGTREPSDAQIRVGQKAAAQIAQRLGWETAEVQAAWWAAGKELFGEHGKAVETYEQFLEEYREDLNAILTKDREGEGRGLQAVGGVPKGTRQGVGVPGTRSPPRGREQVQEQRQGEEAVRRIAKEGDLNYISIGYESRRNTIDRSQDSAERKAATRAVKAYQALARHVAGRIRGLVGREIAPGLARSLEFNVGRLSPDPRIVKKFGRAWPRGFDALGLAKPPNRNVSKYPPLDADGMTAGLTSATVNEKIGKELGIAPGIYTREQLHDAIVERAISDGDPSQPRTALFVGGGMGAGKTTMRAKYGYDKAYDKGKVIIDADRFREWLPEYQPMIDASHDRPGSETQVEVAKLTRRIYGEAKKRGLPIVWDAMHSNPDAMLIEDLEDAGYDVSGIGITIDPMEAMIMANIRAKDNGRYLPVDFALEKHAEFLEAIASGKWQSKFKEGKSQVHDNTEMESPAVQEQVQEQRQGAGPSATQRPTINRVINPKVARTINLEGTKKSWNWMKGPVIDLTRFWNGTRDVFAKTPGFEWMGKAISKHVDLRAKYRGKYRGQMQRAWDTVPGTQRKKALEDFKSYWEMNQEKGRAAADALTISPHAKTLVDATKAMFNELGDINQSRNVHVFDPNIGAWRPIGKIGSSGAKDYFPRMIKNHIQDILHNPARNPSAWNELKDDMIAEGLIDPNNAEADMLKYVDSVMATYRANGFFGSLDRARSPYLPNRAYDYSFDTVRRYIDSWSERMAQIESFGQKLGKQGKDLFDKAYEMAGDDSTKRYIARVRDLAYNAHIDTAYGKVVASLNNIGTATQLAQFASTMKNFVSGMAFNYQNLGTGRFVSSFLNLHATFKEIRDGYERGVLQDDLMNIMNDGEQVTKAGMITGKLAGAGLKVTGFTAAETWVRGVSMVGARAMLRSATRAYNRNRRSGRTRQWLGYFQRLGIDGEALIIEGGKGDLFDAYMRRSVNEIQGGYTYADVPAFMDEPTGRFLLKYQKWGAEQLKHFVNGALKPFVRAATMRQAFKEKVTITNEKGQPETLSVPGAFLPMARYVLVLAAAGAGIEWLLENIFGRHAKTASIAEVMATWKRDQAEGFAKAMDKVFGYWLMAGAGGILGNYLQMGKDFTERTRFKNPAEPPGLDPVKQVVNAAIDLYDQREITPKNVDQFLEKTLGVYRTSKQMAARAQDVFGVTDFRSLEVLARRQDYSWIRSVTRRYDKEIGVRENVRFRGETGRSPESNFRDMLEEDIQLGDTKAAARRIDEHLKGMSDDRKKAALIAIKQSVAGRQPVKAGAGGGDREAGRQNFKRWAERNLSPGENARIKRIDKTYRETAQALDLMRADQIVPEINLRKAMEKIRLMSQ